jgi:hypothetical protein
MSGSDLVCQVVPLSDLKNKTSASEVRVVPADCSMQTHGIVVTAPGGGQRLASSFGRFYLQNNDWPRSWVDPKAGPDAVAITEVSIGIRAQVVQVTASRMFVVYLTTLSVAQTI